jgi:hypothetical protein
MALADAEAAIRMHDQLVASGVVVVAGPGMVGNIDRVNEVEQLVPYGPFRFDLGIERVSNRWHRCQGLRGGSCRQRAQL